MLGKKVYDDKRRGPHGESQPSLDQHAVHIESFHV